MTPVDSLKINQWIAVCDDRDHRGNVTYTGEPCQIVSISLPFIAIRFGRGGAGDMIDTRRYGVVLLRPHYVKAVLDMEEEPERPKKRSRKSEEREPCACPNCGAVIY